LDKKSSSPQEGSMAGQPLSKSGKLPKGAVAFFHKKDELIAILPKKGESVDDAIARVTADHKVEPKYAIRVTPEGEPLELETDGVL
jgi:GTP cyclohydrolase III